MPSFWTATATAAQSQRERCPDLVGFLAVYFEKETQLGLHPVLTTLSPDFDDVSMGGTSFEVRKVRTTSFPQGLNDAIFKDRLFVAVKHPRIEPDDIKPDGSLTAGLLSDIATELQILRHAPLQNHENIVKYLATMYHDAGDIDHPTILPALVTEFAELGSLQSYQANGHLVAIDDKIEVLLDVARGLQVLHECGVVHGDVKTSNVLICKHPTRPFVAKLTDFGYSFSVNDTSVLGFPKWCEAPEISKSLDPRYMVQLDVYSYGLFLQAVLKGGQYFYEAIPNADRDEQADKLKSSGLLPTLTQLNLLLNLKDEKCLLLLLCKILAYSLQPLPEKRFGSMAEVVDLLALAKLGAPEIDTNASMTPLPAESLAQFRQLPLFVGKVVDEYLSATLDPENALLSPLKEKLLERANAEFEMFNHPIEDPAAIPREVAMNWMSLTKGVLALLKPVNGPENTM
jgi:serine/threonine protein kinase